MNKFLQVHCAVLKLANFLMKLGHFYNGIALNLKKKLVYQVKRGLSEPLMLSHLIVFYRLGSCLCINGFNSKVYLLNKVTFLGQHCLEKVFSR